MGLNIVGGMPQVRDLDLSGPPQALDHEDPTGFKYLQLYCTRSGKDAKKEKMIRSNKNQIIEWTM